MPAVLDKSVVYRETPNNFSDVHQMLLGSQIVSIKIFSGQWPDKQPDFLGQLGMHINNDGSSVLWISRIYNGAMDWGIVTNNGDNTLPDNIVREDSDNDYSVYDQKIQGSQIVSVTHGSHSPDHEPIKGEGHIYVRDNEYTPEIYIACKKTSGLDWTRLADHQFLDTLVYNDLPNDFSNLDQSIGGSPIGSISSSILDPVASSIEPARPGEIWVQLGKATENKLPRMWISKDMNIPNVSHWEEISSSVGGIPANVAITDKDNNFTNKSQQIRGNQILSFVNGGDKTPEQSKLSADYDGQFYIAVRGESPAIWVASGNKWIPILSDVAMTNRINRFVPLQEMGVGNRIVNLIGASSGTVNPLSVDLVPLTNGEIYVQTVFTPGVGDERVIWVAYAGGDTRSWVKVYDGRDHTIVRNDIINHFTSKIQYLGIEGDTAKESIVGVKQYTDSDFSDNPNNYTPQRTGEVLVLKEKEGDDMYWVTYMSIVDGKKKAWTELSHVLIP